MICDGNRLLTIFTTEVALLMRLLTLEQSMGKDCQNWVESTLADPGSQILK